MNAPAHARAKPSPDLIARLTEVVGAAHAIADAETQAPFLREPREKFSGRTPVVLLPGSAAEVARCLSLCNEARVGVVPQAGNTGLVGGQIPDLSGDEIVLSVTRLRRVRARDEHGGSIIVEAGLTLAEVQEEARRMGRLFPLSMASQGSCRIGGNLATNAGGTAVLAYGNARNLVLGLEVALVDGRIWNGLRTLKKDNTGYDLKDLFIGSEGTLGVITAAALKLFPAPAEQATALIALPGLDAVAALFRLAENEAGAALTAFEFIPAIALDIVSRHAPGVRVPQIAAAPWYVLIELSGAAADARAAGLMEALLEKAAGSGLVTDGIIAATLQHARDLWRVREAISEAQKGEGGSIKHDVSVPVAAIAPFIARAGELVERSCPGARPVPFGHFGDGNVHYNITQPAGMEKAAFLAQWEPISRAVHDLVVAMGGSISAEHGIGRLKQAELARMKSAVELDVMRAIKAALDPNGILNPGKLV